MGAARRPAGAGERLGTSLGRHLAAKVDLTDIAYLEQLETRSDPGRDPRGRVLATAYLALVAADVEPRIPADTAWHRVQELPPTAFDHGSIAESGRDRLRAKLSYTNIGFALAPATFTIARLRDIYAASVGHPVSATNLQRVLTRRGVIEATPAAARPTSQRRQASHPLPVRGPDLDRHQSFRRVPPSICMTLRQSRGGGGISGRQQIVDSGKGAGQALVLGDPEIERDHRRGLPREGQFGVDESDVADAEGRQRVPEPRFAVVPALARAARAVAAAARRHDHELLVA